MEQHITMFGMWNNIQQHKSLKVCGAAYNCAYICGTRYNSAKVYRTTQSNAKAYRTAYKQY